MQINKEGLWHHCENVMIFVDNNGYIISLKITFVNLRNVLSQRQLAES